jgi:1,4-alpha-glucan branching enzyme
MAHNRLDRKAAEAIVSGCHEDVFAVLGLHDTAHGFMARCFLPGAETVEALDLQGQPLGPLSRIHEAGLFEGPVALKQRSLMQFRARRGDAVWTVTDPYSFGPVLGPMDDYLAAEGTHYRLHEKLGAHAMVHGGVKGVHFAVWAPNARRVSVVGDFNFWNGAVHVMRKRLATGMHEIFIPAAEVGQLYKFEIIGPDGAVLPLKSDPYAFAAELRPGTASRITDISGFEWSDGDWLKARASRDHRRAPLAIYEVHAGSWRRGADNRFLSYDELAEQLIPYVKWMGFTHIEFLPLNEHPYDPSWGYQPTGLFAPTSRFGDPAGFARFVNRAHEQGIGIIMDWVPGHFPTDPSGLARFDGTALYEHADPRQGFHPDWNTAIYNFGRTEVTSFLINNALFWCEVYHVDGLRVDAVASMLYLDYSRREGEWIPNVHGGRENLEAIAFLRRLNEVVYGAHPGIMMIAEESTSFPGVSQPTSAGGLGFGFKWNMGFMNDTLAYMARDPVYRRHHHSQITFGLLYAFSENFVLPLSHDEVVHGKGSLLAKMGGDDWSKFAGLRAYLTLMWAHPGKKLLFMGQELAPWLEWSENHSLDWHLEAHAPHRGLQLLVRDLNHLHRDLPALHGRDSEGEGFTWLITDDHDNSVFAWARFAGDAAPVVLIANLTPVVREHYELPMPRAGRWRERLNSDAQAYWGGGLGNGGTVHAEAVGGGGFPARARLLLPPMASLILEFDCDDTRDSHP